MEGVVTETVPNLPIFCYSGFREFLPNERHINQTLPVHVLIIVSSGILRFREDGIDVVLEKDEYYIQRAGTVLEGIVPSALPKYFFLCFTDPTLTDHFCGLPLRGKCAYERIISAINSLHLAYLSPNRDPVDENYYFYDIIRALRGNQQEPPKPVVAQLTAILRETFRNPVELDAIAESVNYSVNYLIREFKAYHGLTPYQYVLQLRVENAKALLISSNATLAEVASLSGFRDTISLHRTFVNKMGQTPGEYRKRHTGSHTAMHGAAGTASGEQNGMKQS